MFCENGLGLDEPPGLAAPPAEARSTAVTGSAGGAGCKKQSERIEHPMCEAPPVDAKKRSLLKGKRRNGRVCCVWGVSPR